MDENPDDNQEADAVLETLSLTDFPITQDHGVSSTLHDRRNPPSSSSAGEDYFEFLSDNSFEKSMSHAEDIIYGGKLVPINQQKKPRQQSDQNRHPKIHQNQPAVCRRSRSESTSSNVKTTTASALVRNSRSLDSSKKLNRNSSMSSEPVAAEITRNGSGKKSSNSSRWYVLLFGLVKVPPSEMGIRDMKNRQVRRSNSKTPLSASSESFKVLPLTGSVDHQKCSSRVLGFLSCKSSSSAAVTTPAGELYAQR